MFILEERAHVCGCAKLRHRRRVPNSDHSARYGLSKVESPSECRVTLVNITSSRPTHPSFKKRAMRVCAVKYFSVIAEDLITNRKAHYARLTCLSSLWAAQILIIVL